MNMLTANRIRDHATRLGLTHLTDTITELVDRAETTRRPTRPVLFRPPPEHRQELARRSASEIAPAALTPPRCPDPSWSTLSQRSRRGRSGNSEAVSDTEDSQLRMFLTDSQSSPRGVIRTR